MKFPNVFPLILILLFPAGLHSQTYPIFPEDIRFVNDLAEVIGFDEADALDIKLEEFYDISDYMILIVTTDNMGSVEAEAWADGLIGKWSLNFHSSQKMLLIVMKPRNDKGALQFAMKANAAAGEKLGKEALDSIKGGIFMPLLRKKQYMRAMQEGTDALIRYINDGTLDMVKKPGRRGPLLIAVAALLLFLWLRKKVRLTTNTSLT